MFVFGNFLRGIATVLDLALTLYLYIVIVRAVLSWVNPDPYNPIVRFLRQVTDPVFYRATGCESCLNKGFTGRIGIYELMVVGDEVGRLILANSDAQSIKRAALAEGLDTMRDDGARKVLDGRTTVDEVMAATQEDVVVD